MSNSVQTHTETGNEENDIVESTGLGTAGLPATGVSKNFLAETPLSRSLKTDNIIDQASVEIRN